MKISYTTLEEKDENLMQELETCERTSSKLMKILEGFNNLAISGYYEACEILAELSALEPSVYDPEAAYIWYYIALKHQGYSTTFNNKRRDQYAEKCYLGAPDDFRNEPVVASLIEDIGLDNLIRLDYQAEEWMMNYPRVQAKEETGAR